jgi:DNA-binding Lrp family transcriptional regulator
LPEAFVLLNVASGFEDEVVKQLRNLEAVQEAHVSYGSFDLILRIKADTMEQLKNVVSREIRFNGNVLSTLTLIRTDNDRKPSKIIKY